MQTAAGLGARLRQHPDGLEDAYRQLAPMVLGYLRRFVAREDAEDVLQKVFYELWRSRERYDPARPIEAWVLGIARKRAIDHLRAKQPDVVPLDSLREVAGEDGRVLIERYVQAQQVRDALLRLPREQREALTLSYFADYTQSEIADRLQVPIGTVKARMSRGMRRLAGLLDLTRGEVR